MRLHVQPHAPQTKLAGLHGDALKLRVASAPVGGAANSELIRFLAEQLDVPRSRITIVSGLGSRRKTVLLHGISSALASARLGL